MALREPHQEPHRRPPQRPHRGPHREQHQRLHRKHQTTSQIADHTPLERRKRGRNQADRNGTNPNVDALLQTRTQTRSGRNKTSNPPSTHLNVSNTVIYQDGHHRTTSIRTNNRRRQQSGSLDQKRVALLWICTILSLSQAAAHYSYQQHGYKIHNTSCACLPSQQRTHHTLHQRSTDPQPRRRTHCCPAADAPPTPTLKLPHSKLSGEQPTHQPRQQGNREKNNIGGQHTTAPSPNNPSTTNTSKSEVDLSNTNRYRSHPHTTSLLHFHTPSSTSEHTYTNTHNNSPPLHTKATLGTNIAHSNTQLHTKATLNINVTHNKQLHLKVAPFTHNTYKNTHNHLFTLDRPKLPHAFNRSPLVTHRTTQTPDLATSHNILPQNTNYHAKVTHPYITHIPKPLHLAKSPPYHSKMRTNQGTDTHLPTTTTPAKHTTYTLPHTKQNKMPAHAQSTSEPLKTASEETTKHKDRAAHPHTSHKHTIQFTPTQTKPLHNLQSHPDLSQKTQPRTWPQPQALTATLKSRTPTSHNNIQVPLFNTPNKDISNIHHLQCIIRPLHHSHHLILLVPPSLIITPSNSAPQAPTSQSTHRGEATHNNPEAATRTVPTKSTIDTSSDLGNLHSASDNHLTHPGNPAEADSPNSCRATRDGTRRHPQHTSPTSQERITGGTPTRTSSEQTHPGPNQSGTTTPTYRQHLFNHPRLYDVTKHLHQETTTTPKTQPHPTLQQGKFISKPTTYAEALHNIFHGAISTKGNPLSRAKFFLKFSSQSADPKQTSITNDQYKNMHQHHEVSTELIYLQSIPSAPNNPLTTGTGTCRKTKETQQRKIKQALSTASHSPTSITKADSEHTPSSSTSALGELIPTSEEEDGPTGTHTELTTTSPANRTKCIANGDNSSPHRPREPAPSNESPNPGSPCQAPAHPRSAIPQRSPTQTDTGRSHPPVNMSHDNHQVTDVFTDQYQEFRQQVQAQPPNSYHSHPAQQKSRSHALDIDEDLDMDALLENVSPARGGSSLHLSSEQHPKEISHKSTRVTDSTPPTLLYRNPRMVDASESQTTKRRKADDYTATSTPSSKNTPPPPLTRSQRRNTLTIDMIGQMWLGFHMHEALSTHRGKKELMEKRTDEEFATTGTPTTEIHEFRTIRRAFPRTKQVLYPSERPDAVPGQHLHFTQIPMYEKTTQETGLTDGFHVTIRFDGEYKKLNRKEVKTACMERLRTMHMPLGTAYSNPIDIGINTVTRNWAGFIKIHLQDPKKDGLALLRGERAFVMTMGDGERVIGKVEKGFELITKAKNMRLHLKGDSLRNNSAIDILRNLMRESYYEGREIEILSLTKSDADTDFAFITLTTEEARDDILTNGLAYHSERLKVSLTKDKNMGNLSELKISTTIVANNLPQRESQSTITKALKRLFGEENITGITFGYNTNQGDDRQPGWCHIQCLNAAVYTEWLRKSTYILGRRVDFIPHKGSIDGTDPNPTAIRLAHAPVREVIAQKAQAMSNNAASSPLVSEKFFTKTIKELVETVDDKLTTLTNNINLNTDNRVEASTETFKTHATNLHNIMSAMAMEFQQSNHRIHNIMQTLAATSPEPPNNFARLPHAPSTSMANAQAGDNNMHHIAPPGFSGAHYRSPSPSIHKDQPHLHD